MTNGIGRLRTMGIAAQPTFGTPATTASYVLPLLNAPQIGEVVEKAMNEAALGNSYSLNDMVRTTKHSEIPLEFKVDEDQMPLLFKQRFTIASVTASGEAVAYTHTLTFANTVQSYYTLFLQDDNRQDYIVKNVLLDNLDFTFDKDFVRVSANAIGSAPSASDVSNSITQPKEFVGRMVSYTDDSVPGTATATSVLSLTANFDFGINSDDTRFGLGNADLAFLNLTVDKYMVKVTKLKSDVTRYNDYEALTMKQVVITALSTDRFISPTSTRPSISFSIPRAKMENYTEEPDLNENIQESFDLTALKPVGVSGAPMSITVVNSVASY